MVLRRAVSLLCAAALSEGVAHDRQLLTYAPIPDGTYVPPKSPGETTLLDFIHSRHDLSTLSQVAGEAAGFENAFATSTGWKYTFFAPSDTAFNNTGEYFNTFSHTAKGKWWLGDLLQHHYVPNSELYTTNFTAETARIQTGSYLYVGTKEVDGQVILNGISKIAEGDIPVTNGIVHIIDHILSPDTQIYMPDVKKISQEFIPGSCSDPSLPYC